MQPILPPSLHRPGPPISFKFAEHGNKVPACLIFADSYAGRLRSQWSAPADIQRFFAFGDEQLTIHWKRPLSAAYFTLSMFDFGYLALPAQKFLKVSCWSLSVCCRITLETLARNGNSSLSDTRRFLPHSGSLIARLCRRHQCENGGCCYKQNGHNQTTEQEVFPVLAVSPPDWPRLYAMMR